MAPGQSRWQERRGITQHFVLTTCPHMHSCTRMYTFAWACTHVQADTQAHTCTCTGTWTQCPHVPHLHTCTHIGTCKIRHRAYPSIS